MCVMVTQRICVRPRVPNLSPVLAMKFMLVLVGTNYDDRTEFEVKASEKTIKEIIDFLEKEPGIESVEKI